MIPSTRHGQDVNAGAAGLDRVLSPARAVVAVRVLAIPLVLSAITLIAFFPALDNGFVNWDDDKNLEGNSHFRGLGLMQVGWAFTTFWLGVYQPLSWLLFSAQSVVGGLDPFVFHATSLAFHTANVLVLYGVTGAILARVGRDLTPRGRLRVGLCAGAATALFAVHPMRAEPVAWASCQPYLPCALFSLLSVWAYMNACKDGSGFRRDLMAASLVLFTSALLSHAVPVGLPLVLLVLDAYPLRRAGSPPGGALGRPWPELLREKLPFMVLSVVFAALAVAARAPSISSMLRTGPTFSVGRGCHGLWFYLAKTCWPRDLAVVYPAPRQLDGWSSPLAQALVATAAMTLLAYALRRRLPGLQACWLCYVALLSPNSGFVGIDDQSGADRYGYLSMMVWGVLIAGLLEETLRRWKDRRGVLVVAAAFLTMLAILIGLSRRQCRTWKDSETLWAHALTHGAGASTVAHYNLGLILQRKGRLTPAAAHFGEAARLDPGDPDALNNLGVVLLSQGKLEDAAGRFQKVLRLNPDSVDAHYNLATVFSRRGQFAEAELHYIEALRLRPGFAPACNNLGADCFRQEKYEEAADWFKKALRLDPSRADAHRNLGLTLSRLGNHENAAAHDAEAGRLDNADAQRD